MSADAADDVACVSRSHTWRAIEPPTASIPVHSCVWKIIPPGVKAGKVAFALSTNGISLGWGRWARHGPAIWGLLCFLA